MEFSRSTHLLMFLSLESLTFIIRIGLPILVELIHLVNSVMIFLSQMTLLRWFTFYSDSRLILIVLLLFLSSDASICSTRAFPPLGNSDHVVSVYIDFPSNSQRNAPFHLIAYNYSHTDWDSLHDHLRDLPWEGVFKLCASAAASEFCKWVHVGIGVYIPHRKYQVKSHSSHGFQLLVLLPYFIEITFFRLNQKHKSSDC